MTEMKLTVGRYEVLLRGRVERSGGTETIDADEVARLELDACIVVFSRVPLVSGAELRFARRALGLRLPDLSTLLGASSDTIERWEDGREPFERQTQLALLHLLERARATGALPAPSLPPAPDSPVLAGM